MYLLRSLNDSEIESERVLTLIESMEYIEAHSAEKLLFSDIASRCAISYSTYLRSFKRLLGITPAEYQMSCRLKNAADMLQNSDESVVSVAMACGFYDSSHFIREFKKKYSVSPLDFRRGDVR